MENVRNGLTRRDFLKLVSLFPLTYFSKSIESSFDQKNVSGDLPGVIILVFDALSAKNMHLYGYPLQTMPKLESFAERATVYHRHYSSGSFTIPGTASLLSGLYPWSHRAFTLGAGGVAQEHVDHQLFSLFSASHETLGYSQNKYSDSFLYQFGESLDTHISSGAFNFERRMLYNLPMFDKDGRVAFSSFDDNIFQVGEGFDASLFFGPSLRLLNLIRDRLNDRAKKKDYPEGVPDCTEPFLLSDLVDGAMHTLSTINGPAITYLHFHPPHHPYRPTAEYSGSFYSIYAPPEKLNHPLSSEQGSYVYMRRNRQAYDEYLLSWDAEIARLFDFLRMSGLLENNYVLITSDHGEMFERGEVGHFTPLMYAPLIHIPLIISSPGQTAREDIYAPTSSVDVLPSLANKILNLTPSWTEGSLLPGFGGLEDMERSVYTIDAKQNAAFSPLDICSFALTKEQHRLIYYKYPHYESFEFYDLDEDPEELNDLYPSQPALAKQMQEEMSQKLDEVNQPYQK